MIKVLKQFPVEIEYKVQVSSLFENAIKQL